MTAAAEIQRALVLEDIRVLSVQVETVPSKKHENFWHATFYEPSEEIGTPDHRVLIGNLHVHAPGGWATIHVGSLISPLPDGSGSVEEMRELIVKSSAIETLYDFARITAKTACALAEVKVKLPYKAPDPVVHHESESHDHSEGSTAEHS